ncbi:MAG TPA: isoprenylcysteine carboxylmethyltransferase family protein [Rudaea sp.]|nr:isoprenylcysteine carboxylmethyltransferase family protein [Rudaea sp.]
MELLYRNLIPLLWIAWALYWWIAARDVKPAVRHETAASRAVHLVPLALAALLLSTRHFPIAVLDAPMFAATPKTFSLGALILAAGLSVAVWARAVLGRNWSGTVTLKQDHELVRAGPYRWVRHPIYTGLLLGVFGTAVAIGEWRGVAAMLLATFALWRKSLIEERWLIEAFGESYLQYRREVAALIPYLL